MPYFFLPSYYIPENSPYQYHQISNISDTDISRTVIFLLQEKNCVSPIITVFTPAVNLFLLQVSRQCLNCVWPTGPIFPSQIKIFSGQADICRLHSLRSFIQKNRHKKTAAARLSHDNCLLFYCFRICFFSFP